MEEPYSPALEPQVESVKESNNESAHKQSSQPRTIGGFIVDDDEDDGGPLLPPTIVRASGTNGFSHIDRGLSSTPQRPLIQSPAAVASPKSDISSRLVAQDPVVSLSSSNGAADTVSNSAIATVASPPATTVSATVIHPISQTVMKQEPESTAIAKARLPNDRVGMLEDRIKDDPKGDVDAWLSLIAEHRKRNKLADVRATYDRFFRVFPSAVSS